MILYNTFLLSLIEYGHGLLTLSIAQLKCLEVIQNKGVRAILGCTSSESMRHLLDFPPAAECHKITQISAYLKVAADEGHLLHAKVGKAIHL